MGWIHDDENDSAGFHGGFEGGGTLPMPELTEAAKAAEATRLADAMARADEEMAAFMALPTLAAAGMAEYEDIDPETGETEWRPIAGWEHAEASRVTEGSWGWKKRGPVAKIAPGGWEWPVR